MAKKVNDDDNTRNQTQVQRQWTLVSFFLKQQNKAYSLAELAEKFKIWEASERTIRRDLDALIKFGLPIRQTEDKPLRWRFDDSREALSLNATLPFSDFMLLIMLKQLLEQTNLKSVEAQLERWMKQVMIPHSKRGSEEIQTLEKLVKVTRKLPISFEHQSHFIEDIYDALREAEVLRITVFSAGKGLSKREVEPQGLWFADNAIYLVAHCRQKKETRHFALQRIREIERDSSIEPEGPEDFSLEEYVRRSFGAFHGETRQDVILHYSRNVATFALERTFHEDTQHVEELEDGSVRVSFQIYGLNEIAAHVTSFGGEVVPLAPPELIEKVRKRYETGLRSLEPKANP